MSTFAFTIGDIAHLVGITPKTIRHYHEIGLLTEANRDDNNYRLYGVEDLEKIRHILKLKEFGLSLKQIKAVFDADDPDELIRMVLEQHQRRIHQDIDRLQNQLHSIEDFLTNSNSIAHSWQATSTDHSAMTVLVDSIKPASNSIADVIVQLESAVLQKLDSYGWGEGYETFWNHVGKFLIDRAVQHERMIVFWLERYFSLGDMDEDDLQGQAWLEQIHNSQDKFVLGRLFLPPMTPLFPEKDQIQIIKMLPLMLFQEATPLQQQFLQNLIDMD